MADRRLTTARLVIRCYWCGADCTGRFDLIHVPGRNVPVCKGSFGTRAGCPTVQALPDDALKETLRHQEP